MNSLQRRNERYRMICTWKILKGLVPNCVEELIESENKRLGRLCNISKLTGSTHTKKLRSQNLQLTGFQLSPKGVKKPEANACGKV